jgi:hypothetical protein
MGRGWNASLPNQSLRLCGLATLRLKWLNAPARPRPLAIYRSCSAAQNNWDKQQLVPTSRESLAGFLKTCDGIGLAVVEQSGNGLGLFPSTSGEAQESEETDGPLAAKHQHVCSGSAW